MDCDKIKILLSAYLDQELNPAETALVGEHLQKCTSCTKALDELRNYLDLAGKVAKIKAPESIKGKVLKGISRDAPISFFERIARRKEFHILSTAAAAAIILFYLLLSPNFLNTTRMETDFTFREEKTGKGPGSKKGHITEESKEVKLLEEIAGKVDGRILSTGYNEKSGMTDYATLRIRKNNYLQFRTLLIEAGIELSLPVSFEKQSGYLAIQIYFPGRKFVTGDFNGDGEADIAAYFRRGKNSGRWFVSVHDEDARFTPPVPLIAGDMVSYLKEYSEPLAGDLNGDGLSDLVIAESQGKWSIFLNEGNNRFTEYGPSALELKLPSPADLYMPLAGDFDGDGQDDLALHYRTGDLAGRWFVALNAGGPLFTDFEEYPVVSPVYDTGQRYTPFIFDFDGDGFDDCGIYWQQGALIARWHIAINDQEGGFKEPFQVFFGPSPRAFEGDYIPFTGDFDNDGFDDLLVKSGTEDETGQWYFMKNENGIRFTHGFDVSIGGDEDLKVK